MMLGLGQERVIGNLEQLGEGARTVRIVGSSPLSVALPPGHVAQPFNCPAESDFAASQEMGMCAAADYSPIYRTDAKGTKWFINLDGSMTWNEPKGAASTEWIPGIPNIVVIGALGLLLVLKMAK